MLELLQSPVRGTKLHNVGTRADGHKWPQHFVEILTSRNALGTAHACCMTTIAADGSKMGSYAYRRRDTRLIRTNRCYFHAMKLDSANAHPMGSLIHDGTHTPFHALACPLNPRMVRIGKKR